MPKELFTPGQEVTPVFNNPDSEVKFGKVYTVRTSTYFDVLGDYFITLVELEEEDYYQQGGWAPVLPAEAIEEVLKELTPEYGYN